jgi:hypothetical protein
VTSADLVFFFTLLSRDPARNIKKKKKKKKKEEEEERPKKLDHQKKSLFPAEKRLFTSAIKSWMGSSASCHDQDHRMKIEEVRGLVEVEE